LITNPASMPAMNTNSTNIGVNSGSTWHGGPRLRGRPHN
jgi:hypothetical protein